MASKLLSVNKRIVKKAKKPSTASVVSAYEAKTHFSALLERASKGESITITKHGQEVAKLSPAKPTMTREQAVEGLMAFAKRVKATATREEIERWKNEGRM
jgi:prevent-host-death family protein